jgi:glycosyltransferase involved in cell wall biosynthesis
MKKPDFIIASPMATFLTIPAYRLAKKYNAKFIFEVKDIWPLSIIELGGINPKHPLIRAMIWCEKFAIKKADLIVSSLQNYDQHLKKDLKIDKKFLWINNGIDLDEMKKIKPLNKDIEKLIPKDKFIIGYTGTIGIANALNVLCESAKILQENKNILFVIVGVGKEKENLVRQYGKLGNILFIDSIEKSQVQNMLKLFDVCYIGLKKENLFKYGVSPNKLFDYMYSAKPILYAIDSGKANIVNIAKCGISVEAENPIDCVNGIKKLFNMSLKDREQMGENGRNYVLNNFTYENLAKKYIEEMEKL